jgi:ABC-type branched-subunit amino acid transport system substrate-binding protein
VVTQVFPNERAMTYRLIKEAQELAKAKGMAGVSPAMMEGFAAAKVLVEGLRRAGPQPTPAGLRDALEGMQKFDLGGLDVSYSATDHSGLDFAELSIIGSDSSGGDAALRAASARACRATRHRLLFERRASSVQALAPTFLILGKSASSSS